MRHPTWFYIVISVCALGMTGAALEFVGAYRAATRIIPLSAGGALDTRTGEECLIGTDIPPQYRCAPIKGRAEP